METLVDEVAAWLEICSKLGGKLIVAEDGSTDGSSEYLSNLSNRGVLIHCTSAKRRGYKGAFLEGLKLTKSEKVVFVDTGLKFKFNEIEKMITAEFNTDFVIGRRMVRHDSIVRRITTRVYNFMIARLFSLDGRQDLDSGLRIYNRRSIEFINSRDFTFPELISSEISLRLIFSGFNYQYFDVQYFDRLGSSKSFSFRHLMRTSFASFSRLNELRRELKAK